jgi:hypothetical protein
MYVDSSERPDTLLRPAQVDPLALVGGAIMVLIAYGLLGTVLLVLGVLSSGFVSRHDQAEVMFDEPEPPEVEFVEARLIKLGRQFDARELPNRIRDARSTAPRQPSNVPRHGAERVPRPDQEGPTNAVDDLLARIGSSADEQARIVNAAEQEGDPDGVAEGTHTREEGDVYATYLYGFFRRGFQMPTSITDEERRGMRATVQIRTSAAGQIEGYDIVSPSGNADFDQAVRLRLDQAVGSHLREPPEADRARYFGTSFPIRMTAPR